MSKTGAGYRQAARKERPAGVGNLLAEWQPLSQVLPSAVGMAMMIGFVIWYGLHPIRPGAESRA